MPLTIAKEEIPQLKIVSAFVDRTEFWKEELMYAARLGNEFKGKTVITFETTQGPKTVETTVWSYTDKYLQLKGGMVIPLAALIDIHY